MRSSSISLSLVAALTTTACLPGFDISDDPLAGPSGEDLLPTDNGETGDDDDDTGDDSVDDGVAPVAFDFDCIRIDRVQKPVIVPPAGVQVGFRVLDCNGDPIGRIPSSSIRVINDVKGEPFGAGLEGGSVSGLGLPSDYALYSVLALDMSESIHKSDAVDAMIDGALTFVDRLREYSAGATHHELALAVFGRPETFELVVDFTTDHEGIVDALEALRDGESRGSTDLYGAYAQAVDLVTKRGTNVELSERFVVLMTDGTHEAGNETELREEALALKDEHPELNFYSIGIDGAYDKERLLELASTEENFVHVNDADELTRAFTEVAYRLSSAAHSNYAIGVCTPVSLGTNVSLTIELDVAAAMGGSAKAKVRVPYPVDKLTGDLGACQADQTQGEDPNAPNNELEFVLTGDNAYGLGWGTQTSLSDYLGTVENLTASDIFNCSGGPEHYVLDREDLVDDEYLYVAAYSDEGVTQGLLGSMTVYDDRGLMTHLVYTGDQGWEVCATGVPFALGSGGPDVETIEQQLAACTNGENGGWVDRNGVEARLAIGERNDTPGTTPEPGNEFPVTCAQDLGPSARWMWYDWQPGADHSPFMTPSGEDNPDSQFLLFRYPVPR